MEKLVYKMEFCNSGKYSRRGKLSIPFQKGILVSIKSTRALYQELKSSGSKYFLTCKVNSDHLENFFSRLRALGGHNHHPGPAEAVQRIRILLFGKSPQFVVSKPAVEEDNLEVTTVLAPGASQEELEPELSFEQLVTQELTADIPQLQQPEDDDDDDGIEEDKKVGKIMSSSNLTPRGAGYFYYVVVQGGGAICPPLITHIENSFHEFSGGLVRVFFEK